MIVLAQDQPLDCAAIEEGSQTVCRVLSDVLPSALDPIVSAASTLLPAVLRIALIIVLAFVANRLVRRLIRRFIANVKEQGLQKLGALRRGPLATTGPIDLHRATMRTETVGTVLRSISTVMIGTIAIVLALGQIGLDVGPLVAGAGIVGVALGFGAQSLVRDFLSGIFILLEDQYGVGDIVDLGEGQNPIVGTVEGVTLRITRLRDVQGTVWYVPNGEIRSVGNKSHQWARSLIDIGVAYDTDIDHAIKVIKHVADELWRDPRWSDLILEEPEVWGVEEFGPSEILIRLVVKTEPAKQFDVNRELRARIKKAFDDEGIEIPFPQTTVWHRYPHEDGETPPGVPAQPGSPTPPSQGAPGSGV
jgi:small conductance mechanosensitive channel